MYRIRSYIIFRPPTTKKGAENLSLRVATGEAGQAAITDEEAFRLVQAGVPLEMLFGGPQDIEWAFDLERRLFILQCRPPQVAIKATASIPEPDEPALLRDDLCASQGIASGKVQLVDEQTELFSVSDHAIVVTKTVAPRYARIMGRISGLITEVGSNHLPSGFRGP